MEKYKLTLIGIEEWLKTIILSLQGFNAEPVDEADAQKKINELQKILEQLEDKEKTVQEIHNDCEQYGAQYGDVQKFVRELLMGLTSNIQVIRENQNFIRLRIEKTKTSQQPIEEEIPKQEVSAQQVTIEEEIPKQEVTTQQAPKQDDVPEEGETQKIVVEQFTVTEGVKPETHAISTQTVMEQSTDNIMVIQSMNADGETIQIYNVPSSYEEGREDDKNVIVEAKYIRSHSGEPKRASELVLKNVPKHFETTFVEPDETTTEIIVDPDGSKRIIVKKFSKTSQQIVKHEEYEDGALPEHIRSQLGLSGTTHDVIIGSRDDPSFEHHEGITESSIHAVIEHVSHRVIRKTRKIIKKIVIIDGQQHITEEIIEEPDEVEEFSDGQPAIEYEISQAELVPSTETVEIETVETQASAPEIPQDAEKAQVEVIPEQKVEEPIESSTIEGENAPAQVFENLTEAPVDLNASEVDKLAPIEDIQNIWPYETQHIASLTTTSTDVAEQPAAPSQQDSESQSIWPQNLTIGSNIDFNEYSFDRTLERSSDYLDNDSFVIVDAGDLDDFKEPSNIEMRFADESFEQPEEPQQKIEAPQIEDPATSTITITKTEVTDTQTIITPLDIIAPLTVEVPTGATPPPSPAKTPQPASPQMATITIVKTMTFLEQEKVNAEAMMIVRREPIAHDYLDDTIQSQADRSMGEEFVEETHISRSLPLGEDSLADRALPEQFVQEIINISMTKSERMEQEVKPQTPEASTDEPDKATITRVEMFVSPEPKEVDQEDVQAVITPYFEAAPSVPKGKIVSQTEMFITTEISSVQQPVEKVSAEMKILLVRCLKLVLVF